VPFDFEPGQFASALDAYMSRAQSWGIDVLRVPFTWAALEPTQGAFDQAWLSMYEQIVASAWSHGIASVVDFHQDVYSEVYCGDGFPAWTVTNPPAPAHDCPSWQLEYFNDAAVEHAFDVFWDDTTGLYPEYLAAWDEMIGAMKDRPGVLGFEIINEPAAGTAPEVTFEATTLTQFYANVAVHMRSLAPDALLFVDGTAIDGVSQTTSIVNPQMAGIVFAPHYYPIAPPTAAELASGLGAWAKVGASWNVPVFLGEFGTSNASPSAESYIASVFSEVDALGFSGATEWEYSVSKELWNSESDTVVAADGTEYPVAAALIRPYARAVAGSGVKQAWDATARSFTLTYAPTGAGGVTEVRLPARAYPSGVSVQLEGGCYDATAVKGELLVRADPGSKSVTLKVSP
jgi:endoglycosylceramidase